MHFFTLIVLPPCYKGSIPDAVDTLMAPYGEELEVEQYTEDGETYWHNPNGFWDWYQIGGRWTGHLDGYNPEEDPANRHPCGYCNATGARIWPDGTRPCNVCGGTGTATDWPTDWAKHPGDIARLGDVRERLKESPPYHIVGCEVLAHSEVRNPDWDSKSNDYSNYLLPTTDVLDTLEGLSDDCTVVVVDCHS
jgi:hypothetical protein